MRGRVGGVVGPPSRIHGAPVQPPLGHWSERLEPAPGPEAKRIRPERWKQNPMGTCQPQKPARLPQFPQAVQKPQVFPANCVGVRCMDSRCWVGASM